jgi:hypothetical protein
MKFGKFIKFGKEKRGFKSFDKIRIKEKGG